MKEARAHDARRRLREKADKWPIRIERFSFKLVPAIGSGEISFTSPMTFLCGPNGVGKTTLLRGIWSALAPNDAKASSGTVRRLGSGSVVVDLAVKGLPYECETTIAADEFIGNANHDIEVVHLDTSDEVQRQSRIFEDSQEIDSYIEGAGKHVLDDAELREINFLARRDYKAVGLYEVDSFGGVFPFFEVSFRDSHYDSRTMGGGELAVFFLWWALRRTRPLSIILLEEPETFLSPASQEALAAHLAATCVEKKLCVIATTHSSPLILHTLDDGLRFLVRDERGVVVETDAPAILLKNLGIKSPIRGVLVVEDELAAAFAKTLLDRFEPHLARAVDVISRGGNGEVISSVLGMPNTARLKFVAVLDGDLRGTAPEKLVDRCVHLPGEKPVEAFLRDMVQAEPRAFAEMVGSDKISAILGGLEGRDHHDWFRELADELGYKRIHLFALLITVWLRAPGNADLAKIYTASVREIMEKFEP